MEGKVDADDETGKTAKPGVGLQRWVMQKLEMAARSPHPPSPHLQVSTW